MTDKVLKPDADADGVAVTVKRARAQTPVEIVPMPEPKRFDAASHMRKIRTRQGMVDYLDVKWRVAWLRFDHPDAQIITEMLSGDEQHARFKCVIHLSTGAIATGHGSETANDFPDFYEKAETKALGRACANLGYGSDLADEIGETTQETSPPTAKRDDRAQMGELMWPAARTWFATELPQRGFRVPKKLEHWGDVIGVLEERRIDVKGFIDTRGIDFARLKAFVEAQPLVIRQGDA